MTIHYVDSAATGANDGTSWTDAWTSLSSSSGAAAGDTIRVASTHVEATSGSTTTITWTASTNEDPIQIISSSNPGNTYLKGALIFNETGAYDFIPTGNLYVAGCDVTGTDSTSDFRASPEAQGHQEWSDCVINMGGVIASAVARSRVTFYGCTLTCSQVRNDSSGVALHFLGGSITTSSTTAYFIGGDYVQLLVRGADLSGSTTPTKLVDAHDSRSNVTVHFADCELKAAIAFDAPNTAEENNVLTFERCKTGTVTVPEVGLTWREDHWGRTKGVTAQYRTGGANDGETGSSWEMASDATCLEGLRYTKSPPITAWAGNAGPYTVKVYVASGGTLNDDDFWVDVISPNEEVTATTNGRYQNTRVSGANTPSALTTDSSSTWNGSGVGTKQEISFTVDPTEAGPVIVQCYLAKPSTTVYVDPKLDIS